MYFCLLRDVAEDAVDAEDGERQGRFSTVSRGHAAKIREPCAPSTSQQSPGEVRASLIGGTSGPYAWLSFALN